MSTIKLKINTKSHKYPMIIGSGITSKLSKLLNNNSVKFDKCLLIIDNKIPKFRINKINSSRTIFKSKTFKLKIIRFIHRVF